MYTFGFPPLSIVWKHLGPMSPHGDLDSSLIFMYYSEIHVIVESLKYFDTKFLCNMAINFTMIHRYMYMIKIFVSMVCTLLLDVSDSEMSSPLFVGCQGFLGFCDLLFVCRTDPSSDDEYELFQLFERYYQICQEMSFPLPQGIPSTNSSILLTIHPIFQLSAPLIFFFRF